MINFSKVQGITKGVWLNESPPIKTHVLLHGVCFDTRKYQDEDIFVAFKGKNQDGHDYANSLDDKPLKLILVEKKVKITHPTAAYLQVKNSLSALVSLAKAVINIFEGTVVAVTGSSGKTTFQNFLAKILSEKLRVHHPSDSYNNQLGVCTTILGCKAETEVLVLEMGTNWPGEILQLCDIARPHVSVLLNVGSAHLGNFKTLSRTYLAKQEIFSKMRRPKLAILPAFDHKLKLVGDYQKILFGAGSKFYNCEVKTQHKKSYQKNYSIKTKEGLISFNSNLLGEHIPEILSAVVATAFNLGLNNNQILSGLAKLSNLPGRLKLVRAINGASIIDDSYNANPESVINLLKTMSKLDFYPKTLVLGDLAELRDVEQSALNILEVNFPKGIDNLIVYGNFADMISKSKLISAKLKGKLVKVADKNKLHSLLPTYFVKGALLSFKASRVSMIEKIIKPYLV